MVLKSMLLLENRQEPCHHLNILVSRQLVLLMEKHLRPELHDEDVYGDKAYHRPDSKCVERDQKLTVLTPVKKKKGQKYLEADEQWLSTAVSRVRQPIETLFGWIEEKTGIECAGRVRSYQGLMVHVFGRFAAAMFFWNKLRISS